MNLKLWFLGILSNNRTDKETDAATSIGEADGRALTLAYVHGFRQGMTEVLKDEMNGFHSVIEVEAVPRVTKATSKRLPKQA